MLMFVHAYVEAPEGQPNARLREGLLQAFLETFEHQVGVELSFCETMLTPDYTRHMPVLATAFNDRGAEEDQEPLRCP